MDRIIFKPITKWGFHTFVFSAKENVRSIIVVVLFTTSVFLCNLAWGGDLKPFTSDGCSGFPDGTFKQESLWLSCCQQHDYDYWKGGTYAERLDSDKSLRMCVSKVGEPAVALLMLAGVRVGGSPFFPTRFRWGYGWSYPRFYGALTESEKAQVRRLSQLVQKGDLKSKTADLINQPKQSQPENER